MFIFIKNKANSRRGANVMLSYKGLVPKYADQEKGHVTCVAGRLRYIGSPLTGWMLATFAGDGNFERT